eukprot:CAMPEP_0185755270 /NCGR_PEP_ID=MMETSP1174-20130828/13794_1 /TAXON_ID=35687 /ORGANISM="Dictyocha speculum, Strain CCMP1381" /LENGTH=51 /DNA_ID=CAMNT_0028433761 /DNA_START=154 /DNA_END=305 /DNA_ORIENTATION=+
MTASTDPRPSSSSPFTCSSTSRLDLRGIMLLLSAMQIIISLGRLLSEQQLP